MMYSQGLETDVLEVLDSNIFFATQPWWANLYRIFLIFLRGFYTFVVESL